MNDANGKERKEGWQVWACITLWNAVRVLPFVILTILLLVEFGPGIGHSRAHTAKPDVLPTTSPKSGPPPQTLSDRQMLAINHAMLPYDIKRLEDERSSTLDRFAIALKTGGDVAKVRLPVIQRTWLKSFKNVLAIGDNDEDINGLHVKDVVSGQTGVRSPKKGSASAKTLEESDGWRNDAFKNIPGFHLLYTKYPDADWYLMVDDDTYIYIDNLVHFILDKDPEQIRYTGAGTKFVGCDGVTEYGQGPRFAHGGSGILMSKAAMKAVFANTTITDKCASKYRTCMFGDVRVALCLRDHKILLTPHEGFSNKMFHEVISRTKWASTSPCLRPVTQHKMAPHQLLSVYEAEQQAHHQGLFVDMGYLRALQLSGGLEALNETVWTVPNCTLDGTPYMTLPLSSPADCGRACEVLPQCMQWESTPDGLCHFHDRQRAARHALGHVAGRAFVCRGVMEQRHNTLRGNRWIYQMQTGQEMIPSMWDM